VTSRRAAASSAVLPTVVLPTAVLPTAVLPTVVLLAAAALAGGCRPAVEPPWNVVVLLADTLRADHLGAYGYGRDTSPGLDALAAEGVLFESARAQAPCTFPSVNSMLTSRDPARFLGRPPGLLGIPEGVPTLAGTLAAHGYATAAVSASPIVRATPTEVNREGGFDRGFDTFDEACLWREAECVNLRAEALLARLPQPFFLFLHYMDPHDPYRPPDGAPRRFAGAYRGERGWVAEGDPNPLAESLYGEGGSAGSAAYGVGGETADRDEGVDLAAVLDAGDLAHLVDLYDEEIAYWDREAARLLARLADAGLLDRTVVAVVSDHGESFLEAGHLKHCRTLDDREIRTPFVLRLPGKAGGLRSDPQPVAGLRSDPRPVAGLRSDPQPVAGLRIGAPAANLDLVPTLLAAVGIEPPRGVEGRNLLPWVEAAAAGAALPAGDERFVFSAIGSTRAATDGRFKLVRDLRTGGGALYDLSADPQERLDVWAANRRAYRRLHRAMDDWLAGLDRELGSGSGDGLAAGEEAQRRLRALGYLQ